MALSAKQIDILKCIDNSTRLLINGYCHQMQISLELKQKIPSELIQIIILFYCFAEYFDIHYDGIEVLGDHRDIIQKKPTSNNRFDHLTFGAVSIRSMSDSIVVWTFKMLNNEVEHQNGLSLGIVDSRDVNDKSTEYHLRSKTISSYFYCSSGFMFHNGEYQRRDGEELSIIGTKIKM